MPSPSDPPPPPRVPIREVDLGPTPLPLALELPAAPPPPTAQDEAARRAPGRKSRRRWAIVVAGIVAALTAVAAVMVLWVLPAYLRQRCIDEAAAHGITLTVDDAQLDSAGFHLVGVHATAAALPQARASAPELDVEMSGLTPAKMTVRRAEVTLSGPWKNLEAALATWRGSAQGGQGGGWTPAAFAMEESRVVWQAPFAENARVEASNVHLDVTWPAATATVHARSDNVMVVVPSGKVGPWRVDVDRAPGSSRMRVALDPGVPDACTILVVGNDTQTTSVDVVVPRSPLARLGVPPQLLGLKGNAVQVDVIAHFGRLGAQRADATTKGGIYGIDAGLPIALDVAWDGTATGDPKTGLDVKKARIAAGPLVGAVTGTVKLFDDGFRVDLAWSGGPVPCSAFDAPLGAGSPFDVAFQLRKLAEGVGLAKVAGDVRARGSLAFDSRDMGAARVEFTPEVQCQVALFAR